MKILRKCLQATLALGAVAFLGACSETPTTVNPGAPSFHVIPPESPELELLALCKVGPTGTYTFDATADRAVLWNSATNNFDLTQATYSITVGAADSITVGGQKVQGSCSVFNATLIIPGNTHDHIARTGGGLPTATVTVVESGIPAGLEFEKAVTYQRVDATTTTSTTTTNSATGQLGGTTADHGANIVVYNKVSPQALTVTKTAAGTYDRTYSWQLTKSVTPTSHTGTAGSIAGSSTWTVIATKNVVDSNFQVAGDITITNPNNFPVTFSVVDVLDDQTSAAVTCPSNTVAALGTVTCTYTAAPTSAAATLNTATVSVTDPSSVQGGTATAPVSFTANTIGDASVTLGDTRFSYSNGISSSTTVTFPESFPCPSDASYYDSNGNYTRVEPNTATLTGANTNLSADANVTITCTRPMLASGTATGVGFPWSATIGAPNNWFMYSPWVTTSGYRGISTTSPAPAGIDLVTGGTTVAGRITGTRGTTTSITITLKSGYSFTNMASNVMINPMSCTANQAYVQPGKFAVKATASSASNTITVSGLPNTACYGVHANISWMP